VQKYVNHCSSHYYSVVILTLPITFRFQSRTLAKRALRELRLLRVMAHKNVRPSPSNYTSLLIYSLIKIVKLLTIQQPMNLNNFVDLYVIFEIMETDLCAVIKSTQVITQQHIQVRRRMNFTSHHLTFSSYIYIYIYLYSTLCISFFLD
jgi:hypothetical protein